MRFYENINIQRDLCSVAILLLGRILVIREIHGTVANLIITRPISNNAQWLD